MEIGLILTIMDGVAKIIGLEYSFVGELVVISIIRLLVVNLEQFITGLSVLGNDRIISQGDVAERTFAELLVEVGFFLVGRIIDPLANFIDHEHK